MGSIKLEQRQKVKNDQKKGEEIREAGEKKLKEAELWCGYGGIVDLEGIDDDDLEAIEAAIQEADAVAGKGLSETPIQMIDIDPPPGHTMEEFLSDYTIGSDLLEQFSNDDASFQEIVDEAESVDAELQVEFDRIIESLEGIY